MYHISGAEEGGTGYYVTPGGEPSVKNNSGKRIPEGEYPILAPEDSGVLWRQPKIGGPVSIRGIRIHYGYPNPITWTKGCFVISNKYYLVDNTIRYKKEESINAVKNFNKLLGATNPSYKYKKPGGKKGETRFGASYNNPIDYIFVLKKR